MSSQKKTRRPKRQPAPRVVYGPAPWDGALLLVLPFAYAVDDASYYLARNESRTWAEFLAALPSHHRETLSQWIIDNAEHKGFAEYWEKRLLDPEELGEEEDPNLTRAQAWAGYEELSCPGERPPLGHEPFDRGEWESTEFDYNLGPENPQTTMTDTVPPSILSLHGIAQDSVWDGTMTTLNMKDEPEIVALYRKRGYRIARHDTLIDAACGFTANPDDLHRLILLEDIYEDIPEPRPEEIEPEPAPQPPAPKPAEPVTEITADPWLKNAANRAPVPGDAVPVCTYEVSFLLGSYPESAFLRRTVAADELWFRSDHHEGRAVISPPHPDDHSAACELFEILTASRALASWPAGFTAPGLLSEEEYGRILATLDAEFSSNAEAARAEESQLVVVARELGLNPEPSGEGPHHWRAHCPGTNHSLMISSSSDQFGCGYCKVKGGAEKLREFVAARRAK